MDVRGRNYASVGPDDLRALVRPGGEGRPVCSAADFHGWASARTTEELAEPFTFVVDATGVLRLAPRRSEHVVCAGGETVLAPGEMSFHQGSGSWEVGEVTNQSTRIPPQEWDVGVDVDVAEETRP
ncbi:hypothetical protein ACQEVM_35400 [Streptomyces sp. CA-243310]|uniref:hypothetical protein n=1 Tax=Streptomyces sp. CA-243310 TaxID=3240056 RepID=UPI003D936DC8